MATLTGDPALQQELLHGLGDRSRLRILRVLRDGELRVSDVVARTGLSQPNVSKHLRCLAGCGLVEREQRGREVYYVAVDGIGGVFDALDALLDRVADRMAGCELTAQTVEVAR